MELGDVSVWGSDDVGVFAHDLHELRFVAVVHGYPETDGEPWDDHYDNMIDHMNEHHAPSGYRFGRCDDDGTFMFLSDDDWAEL